MASNEKVSLWDARTATETGAFVHSTNGIMTAGLAFAAYSPDGKLAVATSEAGEKTARLWDTASFKEIYRMDKRVSFPQSAIVDARFSPDGKTVTLTEQNRPTIEFWDPASRKRRAEFRPSETEFGSGHVFAADQNGLIRSSNGIRLWDVSTSTCRATLCPSPHSPCDIVALAFSAKGGTLAMVHSADDSVVSIWDVTTRQKRRLLPRSKGPPSQALFAPHDRILATVVKSLP